MRHTKKGILSREFRCEFLPTEPLLGIKINNCSLVGDDEVERPLFRIEVGVIFLLFSFTNVDYSDLE